MLLGQTLCESSLLMHMMSERTQEAADSRELGESKVSLHAAPHRWAEECWGICLRWRGEVGARRGSPAAAGRAPPLLGQGAAVGLWLPAGTAGPALPLPLHGLRPCPSAGTAGTQQPLGQPPGAPGPARRSLLLLSSPACVLCGRVDEDSSILGHKKELGGFYFHEFCAVSSLMAPASFLQPVISIFLP